MSKPTTRKVELQAILRHDFMSFTQKVFQTLTPGQRFVPGYYLDAIAYRLEQVRRGEIKRLIINLPPRSLKSVMVSVAWPAFLLGHDPTRRIICVSYSNDLAHKHANDFRAVLGSPWYRETFRCTRISRRKDTEDEVELTARGYRLSTSVGGTLTGRGGDIIVIDDPLKATDAGSDLKRNAANTWFINTLLSRLDDKRTGAIIIVAQRVHIEDLCGYVQSLSDDWTVLSLPAIAECDEDIPVGRHRFHRRVAGDTLAPEREPLATLEALRLQLGSDVFSAQYQQAPVPPGGAMIKRAWVPRYVELPPEDVCLGVVQSWDTAGKGGPDNDWSVCTTWLQTRDRRWLLLDVWRGRVDYPSLKRKVQQLAARWQPRQIFIEESGTAIGLLQELRGAVPGLKAVRADRDKISRMSMVSAMFEAGQIYFPTQAAWLPELEEELFAFPASRYDDQVDSISQALQHGRSGLWIWEQLAG